MKRFYLSGQNNFGNRGCEALVRSTLQLLQSEFGEVEILVPSYRPDLDAKQWPEGATSGCKFVRAVPFPSELKWWGRARKFFPFIKNVFLPNYALPKDIEFDIASCDALLVIGGDNITLDYGIESLIWHIRFAQHAQRMGKKVMVWGASIGPFSKEPAIEKFTVDFLKSADCVTVRETISEKYLKSLGVEKNVALVADGAFVMTPQPVDTAGFWPSAATGGVLGFNISPLIQKFRPTGEPHQVLQREVANFLTDTLEQNDISILLLPHVDPLDGDAVNSDSHYMREILAMTGDYNGRIRIAPSTFNAAQLKYILSQCTYFIGARTHATIGALSCLVPTVSIAYSIKAKGLNRDLFGNEDYVLDTPLVSKKSLMNYFKMLVRTRNAASDLLTQRIPEWRKRAQVSPVLLRSNMQRVTP
jgi:polysaccharide pyruvyl transferase WcaK-like protein